MKLERAIGQRQGKLPRFGRAHVKHIEPVIDCRLIKDGRECYGQIQDAGPSVYDDADYVFGEDDRRPANSLYNGAGLDVSPALNGCLGFADLNGASDRVNWQFVEADEVPEGPWREIITSRQVQLPPAAN